MSHIRLGPSMTETSVLMASKVFISDTNHTMDADTNVMNPMIKLVNQFELI